MKYIRLFKNEQDYFKEIGDNMKIDLPNVSVVSDSESMFFNANAIREAYFNVTSESNMKLINDYRMFSEIYLNDDTTNLVPELVESSFTIDVSDLEQVNETTWQIKNPKKFNSTYVNSFIVSCDEEILDDYYIGFSALVGFSGSGGTLQYDITLSGTLNELFPTQTLKEYARINSNTIDLTYFFINGYDLVSSLNVVVFKPNENGDLTPLKTTNSYVSNIIEEKTYDISETQILNNYILLDFTLKCEQDILSTDTLFTYENDEIVSASTIGDFLDDAKDGLGVDFIDTKTIGVVNGYFPVLQNIKLYGIMRDGVILTKEVNIVGINSSEIGNYSLSTDKLGENKIKFEITNRFRTPLFSENNNLIRLNSKALKYNKIITPNAFYVCTGLTSITIPNSVTTIGDSAFWACQNLSSVNIPDSVTTIGDRAFEYCFTLSSVTIGNSVTSIGRSAFFYCASLTSVTIPDSVTTIGADAFDNCYGLTSVNIGSGVTTIGDSAFRNCYGLTSVTIPDSMTSIGTYAFYGCSSLTAFYGECASEDNRCLVVDGILKCFASVGLTEYTIPDNVIKIDDSVFENCNSLTSITIPDSVTEIGNNAFANCTSLSSVIIPDSVTSIGERAFIGCDSLTSVAIGSGVTTIGDLAFYECSNITSITIPDSVTSIGDRAFYNCTSLSSVTIGSGVTTIGNKAFENCYSLTAFYGECASEDNRCLVVDGILKCFAPAGLTEYNIPDGVTTIGDYAFGNCDSLISITIPDSVTTIGNEAFAASSGLTSVTIGSGVTTIGDNTFASCFNLSNVNIPDSVTAIGERAFHSCRSLTNVTIPDSVTTIGDNAFAGCDSLTSVTIGSGVTTIGDNAFSACKSLSSVNIPDSVTSIGEKAFSGCTSLSSVTIPNSVTTIGKSIFSNCTNLKNVIIGNGITTIEKDAFYRCTNLTGVTIGSGVTTIGDNAFLYCIYLTGITIPNNVTLIGNSVFNGCSRLASVTIGSGVTSIGNSAFHSCSRLAAITCYAATAPSLGTNTFINVYTRNCVLKVPTGSDYSTWQSALPSSWTIQYI